MILVVVVYMMSVLLDLLQMGVVRRDPVRAQMVNEILENVHHIRRDVMKGNGVIAATVRPRLGRVENVTPIPHVLGNVSWDEMVLRAGRWVKKVDGLDRESDSE